MTWAFDSSKCVLADAYVCSVYYVGLCAGENLTDCVAGELFEFDTVSSRWTDLSLMAQGAAPAPRTYVGFAENNGRIILDCPNNIA